jgi:hypothetical protein
VLRFRGDTSVPPAAVALCVLVAVVPIVLVAIALLT